MGIAEVTLIINAAATVFIALALWVYYQQLRAMKDASKGQNVLALVNLLSAQHVRDARRLVRTVLAAKSLPWDEDEERAASLVCGTYDIVGILIKAGIVPPEPFIENWGVSIRASHKILDQYMKKFRKSPHGGPTYWDDFDWLNEQVARYQTRGGA